MSRQVIVNSHERIETIMNEVCEEMAGHGLMTRGLWRTPVVTTLTDAHLGFADGLYVIDDIPALKILGYRANTIYVPKLSIAAGLRRLGRTRTTMRDVLRHELAHALAYTGGTLVIDDPGFQAAFGSHHEDEGPGEGPRSHFVSDYAMTEPREDFAETVMVYLRYGGKTSRWERRPGLMRKMVYVRNLASRIRKLGLA